MRTKLSIALLQIRGARRWNDLASCLIAAIGRIPQFHFDCILLHHPLLLRHSVSVSVRHVTELGYISSTKVHHSVFNRTCPLSSIWSRSRAISLVTPFVLIGQSVRWLTQLPSPPPAVYVPTAVIACWPMWPRINLCWQMWHVATPGIFAGRAAGLVATRHAHSRPLLLYKGIRAVFYCAYIGVDTASVKL